MDWLQFTASIFGSITSLAWPLVLIVLLIILRNQITGLATRLEEVTLPGGAKAKFEKAIGEARAQVEQIDPEVQETQAQRPITEAEDPYLQLATNFPEAAILESFREIEALLAQIKGFFLLPTKRRDAQSVLERLLDDKYIDENTIELFGSLRAARNAAAHSGRPDRITPGEALEYREQTRALTEILRRVLARLQKNPPPNWS